MKLLPRVFSRRMIVPILMNSLDLDEDLLGQGSFLVQLDGMGVSLAIGLALPTFFAFSYSYILDVMSGANR